MRARTLIDRFDVAGASSDTTAATSLELPTLGTIRSALREDEALIAYQLANLTREGAQFGSWVWVVTSASATAVPVPPPDQLSASVDVYLGLVQRRDGSDGPASARLYADYLAPALRSLPPVVNKLLIVPDDALHRVPFGALRETADGTLAGTRFEMSILPSASMWLRWRSTSAALNNAPALVLADPTLPDTTPGAPSERSAEALAPLPEARTEAAAVARAIGRGSVVLRGDDATERRVKQADLRDFRVLHFAAHALIDDARPDRTAVLLAKAGSDDGRLQISEIVNLPLSGQVVLLSACRSASGTLVPGEGALGLAHAFFRAGARAVVATLWTVRDRDAGEAFSLVAEGLGRGETVASAVASARRTLAGRGEPAAAWAGLVVMGDGNLVPFPGGRTTGPAWWHVVFTLLLMTTATGWIVARRQRLGRQKASPQVT